MRKTTVWHMAVLLLPVLLSSCDNVVEGQRGDMNGYGIASQSVQLSSTALDVTFSGTRYAFVETLHRPITEDDDFAKYDKSALGQLLPIGMRVIIVSLEDGQWVRQEIAMPDEYSCFAMKFSEDGQSLAMFSGHMYLYDLNTAEMSQVANLVDRTAVDMSVFEFKISSDLRLLMDQNGIVEVATGRELLSFPVLPAGKKPDVYHAERWDATPDFHNVVTTVAKSKTETAVVRYEREGDRWSKVGEIILDIAPNQWGSIAISPGGALTFVDGAWDDRRILDWRDGSVVRLLREERELHSEAAAFLTDDRIITWGGDRIWAYDIAVPSRKKVVAMGHPAVAISPGLGGRVLVMSNQGKVYLFDRELRLVNAQQ